MKTTRADRMRALVFHVGEEDVHPDITRWVETGANEKDVDEDIVRLANEFAEVRSEARKAPTYESARSHLMENINPIDPKLPALEREIMGKISDQWWAVAGLLDEAHEQDQAIRRLFRERLTPMMNSDTPVMCWVALTQSFCAIGALDGLLQGVRAKRVGFTPRARPKVKPKKTPPSMVPATVPPTRRSIEAADRRVKRSKKR